jgi:hypothetical protein
MTRLTAHTVRETFDLTRLLSSVALVMGTSDHRRVIAGGLRVVAMAVEELPVLVAMCSAQRGADHMVDLAHVLCP